MLSSLVFSRMDGGESAKGFKMNKVKTEMLITTLALYMIVGAGMWFMFGWLSAVPFGVAGVLVGFYIWRRG